MADDVTLNSMSGGPVVATDDSGTGHVQIVKLAYSANGSRTPVEADINGLRVAVTNTPIVNASQYGSWSVSDKTSMGSYSAGVDKFVVTGGVDLSTSGYTPLSIDNGSLRVTASTYPNPLHITTPYHLISNSGTNDTLVATIPGSGTQIRLYGYSIGNSDTSWAYVKFYDVGMTPSVGSDTPAMTLAVPPGETIHASFPMGISFINGLGLGTTSGPDDLNTGAVSFETVTINLVYKSE